MNELAVLLREALQSGAWLAAPIAFAGGVATALNACCLPVYPAAAAACCGHRQRTEESDVREFDLAAATALLLGLSAATTLLGVLAALGGRTMTTISGSWAYAIAVVPLVGGAYFLRLLPLPELKLPALPAAGRVGTAFLAGMLVALVFGPCGTPLLAGLLAYVAFDGNPTYGGALLFAYGIGMGLPVVMLGGVAAQVAARLEASGARVWVDRATGAGLVGVGLYVIWSA